MPDRSHDCPGGCGRDIVNTQYACPACWLRLPQSIRTALAQTFGTGDEAAYAIARRDAIAFYRDHPRTER